MRHLVIPMFIVSCFVLAACRSKGPGDELGPVLRAMGEPGGPSLVMTRRLYDILDGPTRAAVDARASALAQAAGRKVEPAEVMQFAGFDASVRVSDVEVVEQSDEKATLRLLLGRVAATPGTLMPDPITVSAVREDGHWKLSLPTLAAAVAAQTTSTGTSTTPARQP